MATPTRSQNLSLGNRDAAVAVFSSLANNDTWETGLSAIEHVDIMNTLSGVTHGVTVSGGTITFKLSGSLTSPTVLAIGFK